MKKQLKYVKRNLEHIEKLIEKGVSLECLSHGEYRRLLRLNRNFPPTAIDLSKIEIYAIIRFESLILGLKAMSITWTYLQEKPKEAKRLIGISYENLIQLIAIAKKLDENYKEKVEKQKHRLIRRGGGAKPKLLVEDQIILTLIYLRQGLTFQETSP